MVGLLQISEAGLKTPLRRLSKLESVEKRINSGNLEKSRPNETKQAAFKFTRTVSVPM
jgi:hypothetical protein